MEDGRPDLSMDRMYGSALKKRERRSSACGGIDDGVVPSTTRTCSCVGTPSSQDAETISVRFGKRESDMLCTHRYTHGPGRDLRREKTIVYGYGDSDSQNNRIELELASEVITKLAAIDHTSTSTLFSLVVLARSVATRPHRTSGRLERLTRTRLF